MNPWKVWKAELEMVCSISIQIHNQTVCRDDTQIRKQMLVPDLYVIHSNFQPIMKRQKHEQKNIFHFFLCNFFVQCFQIFFFHKKLKKLPSKVDHNRPKPFISQSSQAHSPQPTAQSPELIFHIIKFREQASVLLSVG